MSLSPLDRPHVSLGHGEPLPLPVVGWGVTEALAALEAARPALDVELGGPLPVSALTTVVLRCGAHAVKVYPPGTDAAHLEGLRLALAGSTCALLPSEPPVVTDHGVVVVMPWLSVSGAASWPATGRLLRAFHDQTAALDVPAWTPLSRLPGQVASLPAEQAAVLLGARAELLAALSSVHSELGVGPVHGDVSPSNALHTDAGPLLIDLDWVARAPREHDLASAARRLAAGEITRREYAGFCAAYGHDVRGWPGLELLDRVADLGGVAFRLWDDRHHGRDLGWLEAELRHWRTPL